MYIVQPITLEKLWGDARLQQYQGDPSSTSIGIVYTVSGTSKLNCSIYNSDTTTTLYEAVHTDPQQFGLQEGEEFPVIIAFDACKESVSFQIHPTDDYAKEKLHLPYGKSEAWYFIEPPEDGWVYAENIDTSKTGMQTALETCDFSGMIDHKPVSVHDVIYIRSGMVHALTKGSLIYEIQQSTDITYRLYDYDRLDANGNKRPLHIQEALANLDPTLKIDQRPFLENTSMDQREFSLSHQIVTRSYTNPTNIVQAISILKGTITIQGHQASQGQSLLVLPHETISFTGQADTIIASPHPYFRT